jgi:hypothetical protein
MPQRYYFYCSRLLPSGLEDVRQCIALISLAEGSTCTVLQTPLGPDPTWEARSNNSEKIVNVLILL